MQRFCAAWRVSHTAKQASALFTSILRQFKIKMGETLMDLLAGSPALAKVWQTQWRISHKKFNRIKRSPIKHLFYGASCESKD